MKDLVKEYRKQHIELLTVIIQQILDRIDVLNKDKVLDNGKVVYKEHYVTDSKGLRVLKKYGVPFREIEGNWQYPNSRVVIIGMLF